MLELLVRLSSVDPEAETDVRVIQYFDSLVLHNAGLSALVRGAAVLSGCVAALEILEPHLAIRIGPDGFGVTGATSEGSTQPDNSWPSLDLDDSRTRVWIERVGSPARCDQMILERLAVSAQVVLHRTRGRTTSKPDPASVEMVLDSDVDISNRVDAIRRLGLPTDTPVRAVALAIPDESSPEQPHLPHGHAASIPPEPSSRWHARLGAAFALIVIEGQSWATAVPELARCGVGPAVSARDLPSSWAGACAALRMTASGTAANPGRAHIAYERLGPLSVLADHITVKDANIDDVRRLNDLATTAPWALNTLNALLEHESLRGAAASLGLHHSTLQARIPHLETSIGYQLNSPDGRYRLYLAMALRRLNANADWDCPRVQLT